MNHPIAPLLKRFFSHYLPVQKGLSINTLAAYRDALKLLLCDVADSAAQSLDHLHVEDLTPARILAFLDRIETDRGCTARTRNARLAAIRSFFAFVARQEPVLLAQSQQVRAIPLKRTPHSSTHYLEEKQLQALLDAVAIDSPTGLRDRALLLLTYNTGARVSEIAALTLDDLRLDFSPQVRLHGKGNKTRSCPLWPETVSALQAYLGGRQPRETNTLQLFLNANGLPITRFGIRFMTRKYGARAQASHPSLHIPPLNPHTLRHTTAMHLLRAGNDILMVSYWLGHADPSTTQIYLEIDMEMKRKMLDKTQPPHLPRKPPWRQPQLLQWLKQLAKQPQLCAPTPSLPSYQSSRKGGDST